MRISDIAINDRVCGIRQEKVDELADSIRTLGLMSPIIVSQDNVLISGMHRLLACQRVGMTDIDAIVKPLVSTNERDRLIISLMEIDENLKRNDLTVLERGEHLAARKKIYEDLHPETKPVTVRGGPGRGKKKQAKLFRPFLLPPTLLPKQAFLLARFNRRFRLLTESPVK